MIIIRTGNKLSTGVSGFNSCQRALGVKRDGMGGGSGESESTADVAIVRAGGAKGGSERAQARALGRHLGGIY